MSKQKTTIPLQIRWFAIILGMVFLFWIPFEDISTTAPLLLATALTILGAVIFLSGVKKPFQAALPNFILAGFVAGIVITPLTLFMMAFKTGLHGHQAPDFSNQQILSIIYRTPIWLIGGLLVGLGSGLWLTYREPRALE
jgi:hypothetical protein